MGFKSINKQTSQSNNCNSFKIGGLLFDNKEDYLLFKNIDKNIKETVKSVEDGIIDLKDVFNNIKKINVEETYYDAREELDGLFVNATELLCYEGTLYDITYKVGCCFFDKINIKYYLIVMIILMLISKLTSFICCLKKYIYINKKMISCYSVKKYVLPHDFKFELFDLKKKNTLYHNHPFQRLVFILQKYYCDFITNEEYDNDEIFEEYFILLDRYYKYGITFQDDDVYDKKKLYVNETTEDDIIFPPIKYIIRNHYEKKVLAFNNVKLINLDDIDKLEVNNTEIEKWKRKVIENTKDRRNKLILLDPVIYNSLITFVAFSKFKGRSYKNIERYFDYLGDFEVPRGNNYNKKKYRNMKIYEDKIYNKIKKFLK